MSPLPLKADKHQTSPFVRFVPKSGHCRNARQDWIMAFKAAGERGRCAVANGWLSSRTRKIALDAESTKTNRTTTRVGLRRENRLKLAKVMVSQKTNTARNGRGIELPA